MKSCKPLKILFSARDYAGAQSVSNLIDYINKLDQPVDPVLVTMEPATSFFNQKQLSLPWKKLDTFTNIADLKRIASNIVTHYSPDIIIASSSGPGAGIDEALVAITCGNKCYVIQDFWGDINLSLGIAADNYLVIDDFAKTTTEKYLHNLTLTSNVIITGSIKHSHYKHINRKKLSRIFYRGMKINSNNTIVSYFGMPLGNIPGYIETVEDFCRQFNDFHNNNRCNNLAFVYRPHPKEDKNTIENTINIFNRYSIPVHIDKNKNSEGAIAASKILFSAYSSSGYDNYFMSLTDRDVTRYSVFLLHNKQLQSYFIKTTALQCLPLENKETIQVTKKRDDLPRLLDTALNGSASHSPNNQEIDHSNAAQNAWNYILNGTDSACYASIAPNKSHQFN